MKIKNISSMVLGVALSGTAALAQNYVTPVKCDITPPSPQSAAIQAVQTPEPDMLTGAVDVTVPIYNIQSFGYTLPVSLQYHSNGIKVFDDPAPLGYGWALQPALRATRTVLGRPEELYDFTPDDPQNNIEPEGACYMCIVNPDAPSRFFKERYDSEHDIFTFSLPTKTVTRVLDMRSGSPVFIGANDMEYKVESDKTLAYITVTDPLGYRHIFGKYYEYYYSPGGQKVNTAWALSEIICDNGKKIIFDWSEVRHPMAAKSWLGGHSFMDNKNPFHWYNCEDYSPEDFESDNYDQAIFSRMNETEKFLQLNSITFTGGEVNFGYTSTYVGPVLTSIKVNNGTEYVKSYSLTYVDDWHTLLQKIDGGAGSVYEFDYDIDHGTRPLCRWNTVHSQDWWGYFNNRPNGDLTPNIAVKSYTQDTPNRGSWYKPYLGKADRSIDAEAMQAMILKKITWPTGGTTSYTYETHKFAPTRQESDGGVDPKDDPYFSHGGGLRVASITTTTGDGDSNPLTINYQYSLAVVRAVPSAATFVDIKNAMVAYPNRGKVICYPKEKTYLRQVNVMPMSDYMRYDIGVTPLWYDKVSAVWPEGKIEVHHADVLDSLPDAPIVSFGKRLPGNQNHVYGISPVLTKKIVYKSVGAAYVPVETTENTYLANMGLNIVKNFHIERETLDLDTDAHNCPDVIDGRYPDMEDSLFVMEGNYSRVLYKINPWSVELKSTKTTTHTDNGDFLQTVNYTYKQNTGLIASVTTQTSEGKIQSVSVGYPAEGSSAIENAMAAANCIGLPLTETITLGSATTNAVAEYMRTASGAFRQRQTAVAYGNATDTVYSPVCEYNAIGNLVRATDADGIETDWAWDANGLYPTSKSAAGIVSAYAYKPLVGLSSMSQPWGQVSTYAYDANGRLLSISVNGLGKLNDFAYSFGADNNSITATTWLGDEKSHIVKETYDNLGRKTMTRDMTTRIAQEFSYDVMGRLVKASVPSSAILSQYDYSLTAYEPSPMGTVISTTKAGSEWHTGDKSVTTRRLTNTASGALACPRYSIGASGAVTHHGNYAAAELMIEETTDENGHVSRTYTNKSGLAVMTEEGDGAADMLRTRRIYDDYGRLRAILPPSMADGPFSMADRDFIMNCYEIGYDACGRQTSTRNPGATAKAEVRYSRAGRTVAEHSATMKARKWFVHFYDRQGREAYTALATLTDAQLESLQRTFTVAEYTGASSCAGYTLTPAPPASMASALSAAYYDDYAFMQRFSNAAIPAVSGSRPGLQTGALDGSLNNSEVYRQPVHYSVMQYDDWGRPVRTDAMTDKGVLTTFTSYDRAGNVLGSRSRLTLATGDTLSLAVANEYDAAGRLTKWSAKHGTKSAGASLQYGVYGSVSKETYLNSVIRDYAYDCHGWLTEAKTTLPRFTRLPFQSVGGGVSQAFYAEALGANSEPNVDLQGFELMKDEVYTETILYADGAHPRYDGTASAHVSTLGGRYDYAFDCHDRLTAAAYTPDAGVLNAEDFSTEYTYNEMGAPLSVKRKGVNGMTTTLAGKTTESYGDMDDLTYEWDGALLSSVSCEALGTDFYGRTGYGLSATGGDAAFTWNDAGLLASDSSHGIRSIDYNWLGQPLEVTFTDGSRLTYAYTCGGELLSVKRYAQPSIIVGQKPQSSRTYCGAYVFENDTLSMVNFGGGYFDSKGSPYYRHADWQGSVTMVTDQSHNLVQHTGYYPYGEPWREPSGQPYLYGGKERMRDAGLYEYDFSARRLNSALCLWIAPDPLATKYPHTSPYAYCAANPIKFTDPSSCAQYLVERNGDLVNIGSDGKDDGRTFVVNHSLGETIINKGGYYNGELNNESNSVELTELIDLETNYLIQGLMLAGNSDERERGLHKDANNLIHIWDPGTEIEVKVDDQGHNTYEQGVTIFQENGELANKKDVVSSKYYGHIHSANKLSKNIGKSTPSNDDLSIDDKYREEGYKGVTFVVGGNDRNITLYNGFNIIATFQLNVMQRLVLIGTIMVKP